MSAAKAQASLCIGKTRLSLHCFKMRQIQNFPIFPDFVSRFKTQAAKAQARLCIGISLTEPSLLENAITVHCEIFQIKHWNINKRVIGHYFLKKVVTGNTQSEHLFQGWTKRGCLRGGGGGGALQAKDLNRAA